MSTEFTSPISISSPFSSTSGNSSNLSSTAEQMFASSFATNTTNAISPPTSDDSEVTSSVLIQKQVAQQPQQDQQKKHKPHKCDICNACFARKVHLQRHALRHQNGRPYCCERCGKCFSRQDSLVRHHRLLHENIVKENKSSKSTSTNVSTPASVMAGTSTSNKKQKKQAPSKRACIRCTSITVKCDGKLPCSRCVQSQNGDSCCYAPISASTSTTIGQASKRRSRQRNDSIATTSSSMITIDDEENNNVHSSINGDWSQLHGPRRDTASSVASTMSDAFMSPLSTNMNADSWGQLPVLSVFQQSQMQQQLLPHPFELPQMENHQNHHDVLSTSSSSFMDMKSLEAMTTLPNFFSMYPQQQQQSIMQMLPTHSQIHSLAQEQQQQQATQFSNLPMFDWSSLMQQQQEGQGMIEQGNEDGLKLPFSGSASNKDLNGTLLSEDVRMASLTQDSTFPSPSIHALQQHNLHMHDLANQQFGRMQSLPTLNDHSAFAMAVAANTQQIHHQNPLSSSSLNINLHQNQHSSSPF